MSRFSFPKSLAALASVAFIAYSFVGCSQNALDPVALGSPEPIQSTKAPSASIQTVDNETANKEFVRLYLEKLRKDLSSGKTLQQIAKERGAELVPVSMQHPVNAWVRLGNGKVVPVPTEQNDRTNHQGWVKKGAGDASVLSYSSASGSMTYLSGSVSPNPSVYNPPTTLVSVNSSASYVLGGNTFTGASSCVLSTDVTGRLGANQLYVLHELYANNVSGLISSNSYTFNPLTSGATGAGVSLDQSLPDGYSGTRYFVASYYPTINGNLIVDAQSYVYSNSFFSVAIP